MLVLVVIGVFNLAVTVLLHARAAWPIACLDILLFLFMALDFESSWIVLAVLSIVLSLYCSAIFAYRIKQKYADLSE
jgi:hypothetical protein